MVMVHQSLPVIDIKIYASKVILSSTEYSLRLLGFKKKKKKKLKTEKSLWMWAVSEWKEKYKRN